MPEKKMSYNDTYNRKKIEIVQKPQRTQGSSIATTIGENALRNKKKSGQY